MEYPDGKQPWMVQAEWLVGYFEGLANREKEDANSWVLGLFMAKNWMRLLGEAQVNLEEAKLFLRALEAERTKQGSGWSDLWYRVRYWTEEIEKAKIESLS